MVGYVPITLTKAEELSLSYILPSWREINWIHTFPKSISAMWNAIILVQDVNSSRRVHFHDDNHYTTDIPYKLDS